MNEQDFCRWEQDCFGFGYGTGELPVLCVLQVFFNSLEEGRRYDSCLLEKTMGSGITWLLINALCRSQRDNRLAKDSIVTYGTSPRFGFLTSFGEELRDFCKDKTPQQLSDILEKYNPMEDPIYQVEL